VTSANGAIHWTNERRKLRDLVPWEHNPREINKAEAERLGESLLEFGQIQTIAVGPDNEVYDGHQRKLVWSVLPQFGPDYEVDVRVSSRKLTDRERQKLVVFLHRGAVGQWDWEELANSFELPDLLEWGFDEGELIGWPQDEPAPDPGAQIDKAAELQEKWGVVRGDVWQCGRHWIMCGDSTQAEDIALLMGDVRARLVFTDPPYGVSYSGRGQSTGQQTIENDDLDPDKLRLFLRSAFEAWDTVMSPGCVIYVCHADRPRGTRPAFELAFNDAGWKFSATIIWAKTAASMGWQDYRAQHEPLLYGWKEGEHFFCGDRSLTTLWQVGRDASAQYNHPTQKPVELMRRAIEYSSRKNDPVMDGFAGSGGTLAACEQTGRIGYGMEIEPKYVSVTLERLAGMGLEPQRVTQ
jgi:DNA modification methylase